MSPVELGRLARKLPDAARAAIKHWPAERPMIGAIISGPDGYAAHDGKDRKIFLSSRSATAMVRLGVAEKRLLWLALTDLGVALRAWLGGAK